MSEPAARCPLRLLLPYHHSTPTSAASTATTDQQTHPRLLLAPITSMPSLFSHQYLMDERGFAFVLPHLGLPDPAGEWAIVPAAIGLRQDVLERLVHDNALHFSVIRGGGSDTALVPAIFQGALWILPLFKPASPSPAAPPEFFYAKAWRLLPDTLAGVEGRPNELEYTCDWVVYSMTSYTDQMEANSSAATSTQSQHQGQSFRTYRIECGPAWYAKFQAQHALLEDDVLEGDNIFKEEWCKQTFLERSAAHRDSGHSSDLDARELRIRVRVRPAKGNDFTSLDYAIVGKGNASPSLSDEDWLPVPSYATKPQAMRHAVNIARRGAGKSVFSEEEWPPTPSEVA